MHVIKQSSTILPGFFLCLFSNPIRSVFYSSFNMFRSIKLSSLQISARKEEWMNKWEKEEWEVGHFVDFSANLTEYVQVHLSSSVRSSILICLKRTELVPLPLPQPFPTPVPRSKPLLVRTLAAAIPCNFPFLIRIRSFVRSFVRSIQIRRLVTTIDLSNLLLLFPCLPACLHVPQPSLLVRFTFILHSKQASSKGCDICKQQQ